MRFGLCCPLDRAAQALEAGFDYVELSASEMAQAEPWTPGRYAGLTIEATNLFFPGSIRLLGSAATPYEGHAQAAIERAASLGVRVMVVGSGGSRRAPEDMVAEAAEACFADVAARLQSIAAPYKVSIAPEPLCREETNVGNEVVPLAERLARRGVGFTLDSYHVLRVSEVRDLDEHAALQFWRDQVRLRPLHLHVSNVDRLAPSASDPIMVALARRLAELGFGGRCSLECSDFDVDRDAKRTMDDLRALFG